MNDQTEVIEEDAVYEGEGKGSQPERAWEVLDAELVEETPKDEPETKEETKDQEPTLAELQAKIGV